MSMNDTHAPKVSATAPNGQVFTKPALLRGYTVRYAILVRKGDEWAAKAWLVDSPASYRKLISLQRKGEFDEVIEVKVEAI